MDDYYCLACIRCKRKYDINEEQCSHCFHKSPGYINTRRVAIAAELSALGTRYKAARAALSAKKLAGVGTQLEKAIKEQGKAVISTSFDFVWEWLIHGTAPYESYRRQLIIGNKKLGLWHYMTNAKGGQALDFKARGFKALPKGSDMLVYESKGMSGAGMSGAPPNTGVPLIVTARDIGNIAAGYVAGNNGLTWGRQGLALMDWKQNKIIGYLHWKESIPKMLSSSDFIWGR